MKDSLQRKYFYFSRLIQLYSKLLKYWNTVTVTTDDKTVFVRYTNCPDDPEKYKFNEMTLPVSQLGRAITIWKRKFKTLYAKRHNNNKTR